MEDMLVPAQASPAQVPATAASSLSYVDDCAPAWLDRPDTTSSAWSGLPPGLPISWCRTRPRLSLFCDKPSISGLRSSLIAGRERQAMGAAIAG
jgi:hypothetical protein